MKAIILFASLLISTNAFSLSQKTKDHLQKIEDKSTSQWRASYLVDINFKQFLNQTYALVWGDEQLSGYCFGVTKADLGNNNQDIERYIDFDKYPVSWRAMSREFSDKIYKESKDLIGLNFQDAGTHSARFRDDVKGKYFKGCKLNWEGSFGGGSSSLYISEDGTTSIGQISSWSE